MKNTYTQGTWEAKEESDGWAIIVDDGEIGTLYVCREMNQGRDMGESDAKHIVKCVNMREVLLEGLKEIAEAKGTYRLDRLEHASSTIKEMVEKANILIKMMEA